MRSPCTPGSRKRSSTCDRRRLRRRPFPCRRSSGGTRRDEEGSRGSSGAIRPMSKCWTTFARCTSSVQQHVAGRRGVFPVFRARVSAAEMDRLTREADCAGVAAPSPPLEDGNACAGARPRRTKRPRRRRRGRLAGSRRGRRRGRPQAQSPRLPRQRRPRRPRRPPVAGEERHERSRCHSPRKNGEAASEDAAVDAMVKASPGYPDVVAHRRDPSRPRPGLHAVVRPARRTALTTSFGVPVDGTDDSVKVSPRGPDPS